MSEPTNEPVPDAPKQRKPRESRGPNVSANTQCYLIRVEPPDDDPVFGGEHCYWTGSENSDAILPDQERAAVIRGQRLAECIARRVFARRPVSIVSMIPCQVRVTGKARVISDGLPPLPRIDTPAQSGSQADSPDDVITGG